MLFRKLNYNKKYIIMKMNSKCKYLLLVVLFIAGFGSGLKAQSDLEINRIFDKYGKQKGSVMVEMSKEMLEGYDFTFYKSIVISNNKEAGDFTRGCLQTDQNGAKKVKQVVTNGKISSVYLQLPKKGKYNRLILFNEKSVPELKMTLIYIESEKDTEEIMKLILKKK